MNMMRMETGCGCDTISACADLMSVGEAVSRALSLVAPVTKVQSVPLGDALGRTSAAPVIADRAMPLFDNSAMDGFALRHADLDGRCCLPVAGTVAAGEAPRALPEGSALRIFTGAPLPEGADTVVAFEACIDKLDKVHIDLKPALGANIRPAGSDQVSGQVVLPAGIRIAPHHIGLLAANGLDRVPVRRRPRIALFSTGDELRSGPLAAGQIPDANRPMLLALARQAGADVTDLGILPDDLDATVTAFEKAKSHHDLILSSGAVSMGGKDHIRDAIEGAGGDVHGWRVALKPGKPVMFGKLDRAAFTGLAGNPFAAHVGFHLFVRSQIQRLLGQDPVLFAAVPAVAGFDWTRTPGRAEVFPVRRTAYDPNGMPVLQRLGKSVSATLLPLAQADGLAIVSADTSHIQTGAPLRWQPFCSDGGL